MAVGTAAEAAARRSETMRRAFDAGDPERLSTAVGWVERWRRQYPASTLFLTRGGPADLAICVHNDRALADLHTFIRDHGSVQPGKRGATVSTDAVAGYIGAIKQAAGVLMGCEVTSTAGSTVLRRVAKACVGR